MLIEAIRYYLRKYSIDERGVTTVEYAIMLSMVAIAVALSTPGISGAVTSIFGDAATALTAS